MNYDRIGQRKIGMIADQCIEEYGSGVNYNRPKWNRLLDDATEQKIKTIVVTHKHRFAGLAMTGLKSSV